MELLKSALLLVCVTFASCLKNQVPDLLEDYEEFFNFGGKKVASKVNRDKFENSVIKSKVDVLATVKKEVSSLSYSDVGYFGSTDIRHSFESVVLANTPVAIWSPNLNARWLRSAFRFRGPNCNGCVGQNNRLETVANVGASKITDVAVTEGRDFLFYRSVFKQNVDSLKSHGVLDLVFLIDASSSVGEYNFRSELKFVKKLLSDVTVDFNHTRVAVVSFSSQNSVTKNVDEISRPKEDNNKCLLLNNEINSIEYTGGGTYTLGAFKVAQDIFKNSRANARKVLFLITDGYSNGGDPVPVATELKKSGVTIFTIGIINGNVKELYQLASEPGELYSYLLDSYEEFENLARRALHVDLQSGEYIPLGTSAPCDSLCVGEDCCDSHALCTCGTSTGHYSCLCELGYYGAGVRGYCSPCPSGSYANGPNLCLPCPDVHHYTKPPAIGVDSCTCKPEYQPTENMGCEVITCPKLSAPENGYFVKRKECSNVLNSACGVRCNVGYSLSGSSIRLCQANASWSGARPNCQVKTCNKLAAPLHGVMSCRHADMDKDVTDELHLPVDTVCSFACERGRTLIGSSHRTCLPLAQWDGLRTACKQIKCNKLGKVNFGTVEPKSCTVGKQPFGKTCNITCNPGFILSGPGRKVCNGQHGVWDSQDDTFCLDVTKPVLKCPPNVQGTALPGKPYGFVDWTPPNVTDNSGLNVTLWTKPAMKNKSTFKFKIGATVVTYYAQDGSGNKGKCNFTVEIEDKEVPVIEACVDPPPYLIVGTHSANITWDEPNIFDNSQNVHVHKTHEFGIFNVGTTTVTYTATDYSNNTNVCLLNITIQESRCDLLPDPIFGHSDCQPFSDSIHCVVTCEEGYAVPLGAPVDTIDAEVNSSRFICEHTEPIWYNTHGIAFPECSVSEIPAEIEQTGSVLVDVESEDVCGNSTSLNEVGNDVAASLESACEGYDCKVQTSASCADKEAELEEEATNKIKRETEKRPPKKRKKVKVKFNVKAKQRPDKKGRNLNAKAFQVKGATVRLDRPNIVCRPGFFKRKYRCVSCPLGTFHNSTQDFCQSCNLGYYNDRRGMTSCQACPQHHSTRKLHAKSARNCIEQCSPGTYAKKKQIKRPKHHPNEVLERPTLKPYCRSCPLGQYQSEHNKLDCTPCPEGYTTYSRGSTKLGDCVPDQAKACSTDLCNGGNCTIVAGFYYTCQCLDGFIGSHCETHLEPCASNPCQNNGACTGSSGGYICECPQGYTGSTCSKVVEVCPLKCKNNATCETTDEDEVICVCPEGFGGKFCEVRLRYCRDDLCENNGVCEEPPGGGYVCHCKDGYVGTRCTYLPCDYRPCPDNATCVNLSEGPNTTRFSYRCECQLGFGGSNCDQHVDVCSQVECHNGGVCRQTGERYGCVCKKGYTGQSCEVQRRGDFVLDFPRLSIVDFIKVDGFEGNLSEIAACLWMKTEDNFNYGTILSYANNKYDNAFTVTDYTGLVLYVNNEYSVTDILLNDGMWHHLCVTWRSFGGNHEIYLDGNLVFSGSQLASNGYIEGHGKLIVGQEQDILGGKFSQSESFTGKMAYLNVYGRSLGPLEVGNVMNSCDDDFFGELYAWPEFLDLIRGDIRVENSTFCRKCPDPQPLYHGTVIVDDLKATYRCNDGYELSDRTFENGRKCTKAAVWEVGPTPFCRAIRCGHPGYIRNGYAIGRGFSYGDKMTYKCNYGYNLTGSALRKCSADGTWKPEEPKCVGVQCSHFAQIANAISVVLTDDDMEVPYEDFIGGIDVGLQVQVICNENATLEGEYLLTCLYNGTWDFPPPLCKLPTPEPAKLPCSMDHMPKPPENGYIVEESLENVTSGWGNTVEYRCMKGFRLVGDNSSTCIIDGYWSEMKISCVVRSCPQPPKYPKLFLQLAKEEPKMQTYKIGSTAQFECIPGYKPFGNTKIRCLLPGVWSRLQGKCVRISCGKPLVKPETRIKGNYLFNDEVQLFCGDEGVVKKVRCGSNATWIGEMSNC